MFCSKCGHSNPNDVSYCELCGAALTDAPSPLSSNLTSQMSSHAIPTDSVPAWLHVIIIVGSIFMPLIGLIAGIVFILKKDEPAKQSAGRIWLIVAGIVMFLNFIILFGG
jgi:uncharacterized membrane protein YvbJ